MNLCRICLAILGLALVTQGGVQLINPEIITSTLQIAAGSITGQIELKVIYGGLHIAYGAICLWGALRVRNTRAALTTLLILSIGVALPRVALSFSHSDFSRYSVVAMSLETFTVLLLGVLLHSSRRGPTIQPTS